MQLRYLVTGTGRSGTVFMARLLTSVGIPCSHEMIFDYHGLDQAIARMQGQESLELSWVSRARHEQDHWQEHEPWLLDLFSVEAESSYMAAPFLRHDSIKEAKIIHVVRDPVKVVNSYCNYLYFYKSGIAENSYEDFVYTHLPELKLDMPQYDRAALFWVRWNQMIEKANPDYFHRVEDDSTGVLRFMGKEGPCFCDSTINTFKKSTKDRFFPNKIVNKEIKDEFVALGKKYGYPMRSEYLLI